MESSENSLGSVDVRRFCESKRFSQILRNFFLILIFDWFLWTTQVSTAITKHTSLKDKHINFSSSKHCTKSAIISINFLCGRVTAHNIKERTNLNVKRYDIEIKYRSKRVNEKIQVTHLLSKTINFPGYCCLLRKLQAYNKTVIIHTAI